MQVIRVSAAILLNDQQILLSRRKKDKSYAGMWEFPGGKTEPGESYKIALKRELFEELNIEVSKLRSYCYTEFLLCDSRQINIKFYLCTNYKNTPQNKEGQELGYFAIKDIANLNFPPADKQVVCKLLKEFHN